MYAQDYDENIAPNMTFDWANWGGTNGSAFGMGTPWWMDLIQPYVKNLQLFVCPSRSSFGKGQSYWGAWPIRNPWSYARNYRTDGLWYPDLQAARPQLTALAGVQRPAERILHTEQAVVGTDPCNTEYQLIYLPYGNVRLHAQKIGYSFFDGHVKSMRYLETVRPGRLMWNVMDNYPNYATAFGWELVNNEAEELAAIEKWHNWIKSIVPNADEYL